MNTTTDQKTEPKSPGKAAQKQFTYRAKDKEPETVYTAVTDWMTIRKKEKPVAEIFYTYYSIAPKSGVRPITFVFNGGPGAASAYLHVGVVGPKRVLFTERGELLPPPAQLVDNSESWLRFTDVVFVDPVGTGFSRAIEESKNATDASKPESSQGNKDENKDFFEIKRDLEVFGEFIASFLSKQKRWSSPIFLAGESYGGFRVAKLAKLLQQGHGIGLNGVMLISPAIEFSHLWSSDYDITQWIEVFPSLVATAAFHKRSSAFSQNESLSSLLEKAQKFAVDSLTKWLVMGDALALKERKAIAEEASGMLGVSPSFIELNNGRVSALSFSRELLRDRREVCGLYDATLRCIDPFPNRDTFQGADPTLYAIERAFCGAINTQLRENIGVETDREYLLLNLDVFNSWKMPGTLNDFFEKHLSAADDLRYAMSLNAHMKVLISHGYYDLVTPYYSSERIINHMHLSETQRKRLTFKNFGGGHMFYAWESSRIAFTESVSAFIQDAID